MLWAPLALAALNQPPREAAAPTFVRVLAEMFGPEPQAASIAFPAVPLDVMYAAPARDHIEERGGKVMTNALARVIVEGGRAIGVRTRGGGEVRAEAIVAAVPWFAVRSLFDDVPTSLQQVVSNAGRMASYPIVTVNLWFDRSVLGTPFVGLPGRTMQWAFDRGALTDARVSLVSLVSSGAVAVAGLTNDATVNLALRGAPRRAAARRPAVVRKASVVRERRATFSLAPGQPARPATDTPLAGFYLAGDWTTPDCRVRSRALPRAATARPRRLLWTLPFVAPRRRGPWWIPAFAGMTGLSESRIPNPDPRAMTSILVHYQEIALKGRNRPYFISKLVHNLRKQTAGLDVKDVRALMGRIEIVLGPSASTRTSRTGRTRVRHRELLEGGPRAEDPG